jgi:dipeptidyl aminopeptidase/acylaminoacyl peptidase
VGLDQIVWTKRTRLLVGGGNAVFSLTTGGKLKLLARNTDYSFSTDRAGDTLAWGAVGCPTCSGPITILDVRTGRKRAIGGDGANAYPTLSPDGREVAFTRGARGIWVANTDGTGLHRLTVAGQCAKWSPDRRTLAFLAPALHAMSPSGGDVRRVARARPGCGVSPINWAWSPDSKQIAYLTEGNRLAVVTTATGKTRTLQGPDVSLVDGFAWSPDSRLLLVTAGSPEAPCSSLYRVRSATLAARLLRAC